MLLRMLTAAKCEKCGVIEHAENVKDVGFTDKEERLKLSRHQPLLNIIIMPRKYFTWSLIKAKCAREKSQTRVS